MKLLNLTRKYAYATLNKTMVHHKNQARKIPKLTPLIAAAVVVFTILGTPLVHADQFEEQIKQKQAEQAQAQAQSDVLGVQAGGIQGEIDTLRNQIAGIQAQIDTNQAKQNELTTQIEDAQKKLDEQKEMLSANIKSMYIEGDISPLEMIASSKNLGDFVDKQEYRDRIKDSITSTLDEIERLKKQLDDQRKEVIRILDEQKTLRGSLSQKEGEASTKLAAVSQDKASFDASVQLKSTEISALRAQQAAANRRFTGGSPGTGPACGGGYPGKWCEIPMDSVADDWGMYNRECVSYAAFKVAQSGRNMPNWGRTGPANANQWPGRAAASGIPYDSNPRAGDVAISMAGYYGHAMYVEAVNGDGTIVVSQYNAGMDGRYTPPTTISAGGLYFIHF